MLKFVRAIRKRLDTEIILATNAIRFAFVNKSRNHPDASWHNAVLKNETEVESAIKQIRKLGLPLIKDLPKNWDALAAVDLILRNTETDARIFDAGGEVYSMILPWLALYGYKNLVAGNLVFKKPLRCGPISYIHSDITQTGFEPESFDAVTCMSVIEHGVNLRDYFREMARILKAGGVLVTSADYFETPIDTSGLCAYGSPIHIFSKDEIISALAIAAEYGLEPISPLDPTSCNKVARWKRFGLDYTFIVFSLRKSA